ncbi:hypothetical protein CRUP_012832 [Coryphaenoides rupestris]|nr:hypothetical protein CRUP_012832 [Coryphaenoides rupestris]
MTCGPTTSPPLPSPRVVCPTTHPPQQGRVITTTTPPPGRYGGEPWGAPDGTQSWGHEWATKSRLLEEEREEDVVVVVVVVVVGV